MKFYYLDIIAMNIDSTNIDQNIGVLVHGNLCIILLWVTSEQPNDEIKKNIHIIFFMSLVLITLWKCRYNFGHHLK